MSNKSPIYADFLSIKNHIEGKLKLNVYDIGETYLQGLSGKTPFVTRDIDVVIVIPSSIKEVRMKLDSVLNQLNYGTLSSTDEEKSYLRYISGQSGKKLDVFLGKVFMFHLTPAMQSRAKNGKLCSEDFFLFKIQSTRRGSKDLDDIKFLLRNRSKKRFNYHIVIRELEYQLSSIINLETKNEISLLHIMERVDKLNQDDEFSQVIPTVFLNEIERVICSLFPDLELC